MSDGDRQDRGGFEDAARGASEAVRRAARVLEEELQSGLSGLHRLQEVITEKQQVDQEAFDEVLQRLRANGRQFIEVAANRIGELKEDDVQELTAQFSSHAQDLFDTTVSLMSIVPDIINRLATRGREATGDAAPQAEAAPQATAEPEPEPQPEPGPGPGSAAVAQATPAKKPVKKAEKAQKAQKAQKAAKKAPKRSSTSAEPSA